MGRKHILVVDDEADMRVGLSRLLSRAGYRVELARDGTEVLPKLNRQGWYDAIVLDLMMPGQDGYKTMRDLSENGYGDVPVVLVTAKFSPTDVALGHDYGAAVFIRKPFSPSGLISAIEYAMQKATRPKAGLWLD